MPNEIVLMLLVGACVRWLKFDKEIRFALKLNHVLYIDSYGWMWMWIWNFVFFYSIGSAELYGAGIVGEPN